MTDEEHDLIWACYMGLHYDFEAMLEHANESDVSEVKKDIPSIKRLADFEKKYQVKLYQLLGCILNYRVFKVCPPIWFLPFSVTFQLT